MARTESTMVELGTTAPPFQLLDVLSDRAIGRDDLIAASSGTPRTGLLVMFLCPHCPYVRHIESELANIGRDYAPTIAIAAIQSNDIAAYPQDGPDGMRQQAARLGWTFPYLLDDTQQVAREYNAACTPDFFLFDSGLRLVYRGQLDPSRPNKDNPAAALPVTGADLRAALDAVSSGQAPDPDQRTSLGCNIKWKL